MDERRNRIVSDFADYDRFAGNCLNLCLIGAAIAVGAAAIAWAEPVAAWLEAAL